MEEKKYYETIQNLIRTHRRYPGTEDIFDEIVSEVYKQAEDVINSVSDEETVIKYLTKIVSIAMITVPKRSGIKTTVNKSPSVTVSQIQEAEEIHTEEVYIDSLENTSKQEDAIEEIMPEPIEDIITEENNEIIIKTSSENGAEEFETDNLQEDIETEFTELQPNQELVEKMINGVPSDTIDISNNIEDITFENLDTIELESFDDSSNVELDSSITDEADTIDDNQDINILDETITLENETVIKNIEVSDSDNIDEIDNAEQSINTEYVSINSNYQITTDYSNIKELILELDKQHPELKIIDIFNYKYKQKYTITKIANDLDMDISAVVEGLNLLTSLIEE